VTGKDPAVGLLLDTTHDEVEDIDGLA